MQRLYFTLSILVLTSLLSGCAGNAAAESNEIPPTSVPEKAEPTAVPKVISTDPPSKSETVPHDPPADCPVTTTGILSFEAPAPYSPSAPWHNQFWFGSEHLWTALPANGVWSGLPNNPEGYTQKIFWWSTLFSLKDEPEPALVVEGERLDAKAPPLKTYGATNAFASDIGEAMLTGVDFPTAGCWEVRGQYKKTELIFVVWVAP